MIESITQALQNTSDAIQSMVASLPLVIVILLIVALIIIMITLIMVHISMKRAAQAANPEAPPSKDENGVERREVDLDADKLPPYLGWFAEFLSRKGYVKVSDLSLYFLRGLEFLRKYIHSPDYKYRTPWFMVVGSEKSGKTTFLNSIRMEQPFGPIEFQNNHPNPPCRWMLFKRGLFIDVRGDIFLPQNTSKSTERNWRSLLVLLSRYRSARPLNGIIVTIPATELYGSGGLSKEAIGDQAQIIASRLMTAQQSLGIKLPIYIVITKADTIPGFQSFCSRLPRKNRDDILGWSSHYALDMEFNSQWIDEAFNEIDENLTQAKLEMLAQCQEEQIKDGVFVFPHEFPKLKDSLSIYLNQIFKSDGYQEPVAFRGIYFCGDSGLKLASIFGDEEDEEALFTLDPENVVQEINNDESLAAQLPRRKETKTHTLYFVNDLVCEKILYEYGLANPLRNKIATINRGLNIAKASTALFILFGTYGLFNTYDRFMQGRDQVIPMLEKINSLLIDVNCQKNSNNTQTSYAFDIYARELIEMMHQLQDTRFFSVLIPPSWFSPLQTHLNRSLKIAYQQIIIRTIYVDLLLKARDLLHLKPSLEDQSTSIGQMLQPLTSKEFLLVKRYVEGLEKLQIMTGKFNDLKRAGDSTDLEELVQYTFRAKLPQKFIENYSKFRGFLRDFDFPVIELKPYMLLARETLNVVFQNYLDAIFTVTKKGSLPDQINTLLRTLSQKDKAQVDLDYVRKFSLDLAESKVNLGEPGKTWLDAKIFNPGKEFDELFDKIDNSTFFGKDISQFLVDQTAIGFQNLKMQLQVINQVLSSFPADLKKSLTDNKGKPLAVSSGILNLEKILTDLFKEPYMAVPTLYPLTMYVPTGKMVYWDAKLVEFAHDMVKKYEDYAIKNAAGLPPAIHENLMIIARQSLQENIISVIGRAQNFVSYNVEQNDSRAAEEILRTKVNEMRDASPKFTKLLEVLRNEAAANAFMQLRELLSNNTMWLLQQVEKILQSYAPYAIKDLDFSWWDGKPGAVYAAYSVKDTEDLAIYLDRQRQHLGMIGLDFAKPLVQFMTSRVMTDAPGDKTLINRWKRIVDQLEGYQRKQPNNSLTLLEDFLTLFLPNCDARLCLKELKAKDLNRESGDYFLETLRKINKGLLRRSEVIQRQMSINNYMELTAFYNKHLRGHFPFVGRNASEKAPDAEPFLIKEFFQKFEAFGGSAKAVLDQVYQLGAVSMPAYEFLKSLDEIQKFFQHFLSGGNDFPSFDMIVDFRVNRRNSKGDGLVVDWMFKPNDLDTLNNHAKQNQGVWVLGQSVEMAFRWPESENIPDAPRPDFNQPRLNVDGKTAKFKFTGPWSLLWLLRKQADPSAEKTTSKAYLLKFKVPIGNGKTAVLYNQLTLMAPSPNPKKPGAILEVPDFPEFPPELPREILQQVDKPLLTDGKVIPFDPESPSQKNKEKDPAKDDEKSDEKPKDDKAKADAPKDDGAKKDALKK